jgi:hypothetical protein
MERYGGYSSVAERRSVAADVVGSKPTSRPNLFSEDNPIDAGVFRVSIDAGVFRVSIDAGVFRVSGDRLLSSAGTSRSRCRILLGAHGPKRTCTRRVDRTGLSLSAEAARRDLRLGLPDVEAGVLSGEDACAAVPRLLRPPPDFG